MLLSILRLFPRFRWIEEVRDKSIVLEDRIRLLEGELSHTRELLNQAIDGERKAYQMWVNVSWQQKYNPNPPYPDVPHIPVERVPQENFNPVQVPWKHGRQLVDEGVSAFRSAMDAYINRHKGSATQ